MNAKTKKQITKLRRDLIKVSEQIFASALSENISAHKLSGFAGEITRCSYVMLDIAGEFQKSAKDLDA